MAGDREQLVQGEWVHSHEEDTDSERVFRPATHHFPPARGRTAIELLADGTYVERTPGPVDVPERSRGSWSLDGDRLVLGAGEGGARRSWEISSVEPECLRIRK